MTHWNNAAMASRHSVPPQYPGEDNAFSSWWITSVRLTWKMVWNPFSARWAKGNDYSSSLICARKNSDVMSRNARDMAVWPRKTYNSHHPRLHRPCRPYRLLLPGPYLSHNDHSLYRPDQETNWWHREQEHLVAGGSVQNYHNGSIVDLRSCERLIGTHSESYKRWASFFKKKILDSHVW